MKLVPLALALAWIAPLAGPAAGAEGALPPRVLALRPADAALTRLIEESRWFRFAGERLASSGWRLEIGPAAAGAVPPEVEVHLATLPLGPRLADFAPLAAGLPVELALAWPVLGGTNYRAPGSTLALRLPGARQRWLVMGGEERAVADLAVEIAFGAIGLSRRRAPLELDFQLRESPWLERTGRWRKVGQAWAVDPATDRDAIGGRDRWFASLVPVAGGGGAVRLLVPAGRAAEPALVALAAELERAVVAMAARIPLDLLDRLAQPLTVALEADHASQGRHTGEVGAAVPGGPADLHLVERPEDRFAHRVALAEVLLRRAGLRREATPWLDAGAALWLAGGEWYGRDVGDWLPRLAAAEVLPTAAELLSAVEQEDGSRPLWTPVAAAWVDRLPGSTAREKLARVPGEPATRAILSRLSRLGRLGRLAPSAGGPRTPRPLPAGFLSGASLAMENSLEGGYHAPGLGRQLDRLAGLGADAVALMPFGYQQDPRRPELGFLNRGPASENDPGMIHAARMARDKGFSVLWKPHLWISYGSWPGDVEMGSEADWRTWWRVYRRFIVHHALLAEWAGADLFSVGVELDRTVTRERDWSALIAAVRRFYAGPVTYAANWGQGAETVSFWHQLDAVGVDGYYPLAPRSEGEATAEALRLGAAAVVAKLETLARRAQRPLILTEVGFPARLAAWGDPHDESGEPSVADQERAYRALLPALEGRDWLRGVFVWKVFSGERSATASRADFQFLGRPAERWVSEFWRAEGRRNLPSDGVSGVASGVVSGTW